jgi:membrane protein
VKTKLRWSHGLARNSTPSSLPAERGRGRKAAIPAHIPWPGWKDILLRTYNEILNDRLLAVAGGVIFYSRLSLFPAIAVGVSSYAMFFNASTIADQVSLAAVVVPANVLDMFRDEIMLIAGKSDGKLTLGFAIGLVIALWSANAGVKAMFDALNVIYDEREKRGIIKLNLVSLLFTVCAIGATLWRSARWWYFHWCSPHWGSRRSTGHSSACCAGR